MLTTVGYQVLGVYEKAEGMHILKKLTRLS
jgi:hypothetical protein